MATVPEGERRCVVCGERMKRELAQGVTVDVCDEHGIWLDKGELPRIIERIRERSHEVRRIAMQRTYEQGKSDSLWWGFWT
jgi:Zn-finger nucleic acid-binding protein